MQILRRFLRLMRTVRGWTRILWVIALMTGWAVITTAGVWLQHPLNRARFRARQQRIAARILCRAAGFRVTTAGKAPPAGPMLYVSNHITALDPIWIGTQVEVSFAGKMEITGWPVLGWIANTHGIIGVERGRRSFARDFVEAIRCRLAAGVPVMVFPEGGIGWGDTLLPFKTSAFEAVACSETGRVQPVFMDVVALDGQPTPDGEGRFMLSYNHHDTLFGHLAHVFSFRRVKIEVHFGQPLSAALMKRKTLADKTHAAVVLLEQQKQ